MISLSLSSVLWVCLAGTARILGLVVKTGDHIGGSLTSDPRSAMSDQLSAFQLVTPSSSSSQERMPCWRAHGARKDPPAAIL